MKRKAFSYLRKHGLKTVVFLLLAALIYTILPTGTVSAAAPMSAAVRNAHQAGVKMATVVQDKSITGSEDQLPQAGGISPSTLLGLVGLAFITTGGTVFTILKKKSNGKND